MIFSDFKQGVADVTGQFDADTMQIYGRFINNRYRMIWNRLDWKDSLFTDTFPCDAESATTDLPSPWERIISIRYKDHFLDPADDTFFIETDPSMWEREGTPQYYQEQTLFPLGTKQIRFFPAPIESIELLIVGKLKFVPMVNGTDEPFLRNIDDCLLAFAIGDGYKRLRQLGKAAEQYKEAEQAYQEAVALEKQQTNVPRRTKNLTISGNSLAEMTDDVCARCNDWMPDTRIFVKQMIRRKYQQVYDSVLWPESLIMVDCVSAGEQVILPEYIARVINVRMNTDWRSLTPYELSNYFITPAIFEQLGSPITYGPLSPVAVSVLPPLRELLAIVSTDPNDKGQVMVKGESAGMILYESVTMDGTTPVYTAHPYDIPTTVAKGLTLGTVSVTGASSGLLLETIPPDQRERKHVRLWLKPHDGTSNIPCLVLGKRRIVPLIQDEDTPEIRGIQDVLIYGAAAECFTKAKAGDLATDAAQKATACLNVLVDNEVNQTSRNPVVVPYVEPMPEEWSVITDDWFYSKY